MSLYELETTPLGPARIHSMLRQLDSQTHMLLYDELARVTSLKQAFNGKKFAVIYFRLRGSEVGHWICMVDYPSHYEHFDPYGISIDRELSITHEGPYLSRLMATADKHVITNTYKFQKWKLHMNTCARWVVVRIYMSHMGLTQLYTFVNNTDRDHDKVATLLTMLL